jgi:hypothetical protein
MANTTTATCLPLFPSLELAWRDVDSSFERFCLTAGIGAIEQMLCADAQQLAGPMPRCLAMISLTRSLNITHRFPTSFLSVEVGAPFCALREVDQVLLEVA